MTVGRGRKGWTLTPSLRYLSCMICVISRKTKGPGEKGATRNHPEISFQKLADSSADFLMTPMEGT